MPSSSLPKHSLPDERTATGIPGLDEILDGGLPRNRFYLIEGEPGSGKTTLALQFLLEGKRLGERTLYITLSETKEELDAVASSHGWSLDGIDLVDLSAVQDILASDSANTVFHPSEVELGKTTQVLLKSVEQLKPARVVFDSLSEMKLLAQDALRYRRQMLSFKQFFAGRQCTVLLLDDQVSGEDLQVRSLSHGVIRLERVANDYGPERRRLRVVKVRGLKFRGGYHDYTVETGKLVVYPRLVASEHMKPFAGEKASSGIPELDTLLGGGLVRGTSNMVLGPAGSGKSSLSNAFIAAALERGESALIITFDENERTLIARASSLGFDFARGQREGKLTIQQVDAAELSPGDFVHRIRTAVERDGASMVLVDSLNGYMNAMPEERFLAVQLRELLSYLSHQGIISLLVMAQHGMIGSMHAPADVTYLADAVILARFFEAQGAVRKALSVIKKRIGGHEDTIREYSLKGGRLVIGPPLVQFHGVLTGVPQFSGKAGEMLSPRTA
jgi:circadian clock protein KaiC